MMTRTGFFNQLDLRKYKHVLGFPERGRNSQCHRRKAAANAHSMTFFRFSLGGKVEQRMPATEIDSLNKI